MNESKPYIGRFAPSPTGPLHFGSMIAAVASYLEARTRGGKWLVRMEDIDPLRETPGTADAILRTLERFEMPWDDTVMYQSTRLDAYADAIEHLLAAGNLYPCACSRKEISLIATRGINGYIYAGTCRDKPQLSRPEQCALRLKTDDVPISFTDSIQGRIDQHILRETGDFVLKRADGLIAYQLAVVVDDAAQGVSDVVRGSDLLPLTAPQLYLQQLLGYQRPRHAHVPVATNTVGEKWSKQTGAPGIDALIPGIVLFAVLDFLGQQPPTSLYGASLPELWQWARQHWALAKIPQCRAVSHPALPA